MFAQAAGEASAAAPAVPCWDTLQSRYSNDATDQSDDEESPVGERYLTHETQHDLGHDGEESEDEDDALEAAVWAAIHEGTCQILQSCLPAWMLPASSCAGLCDRVASRSASWSCPGHQVLCSALHLCHGWFISSVLAAFLLTKT